MKTFATHPSLRASLFIMLTLVALTDTRLTPAIANPSAAQIRCVILFKRYLMPLIVPDLRTAKPFIAYDRTDPANPIELKVTMGKRRLGFGMKGAVYEVAKIEGEHPALTKYAGKDVSFVLKTSHVGRRTGIFKEKFQKILVEEHGVYTALMNQLPKMEADPFYPSETEATWNRGTLPISPILADLETPYGRALLKLKIDGMFVPDLSKLYLAGTPAPEEMVKSGLQWYDVSQAASNTVLITPEPKVHSTLSRLAGRLRNLSKLKWPSAPQDRVFPERLITSIDINPENLVWVDRSQPVMMDVLSLKEPSFVAVELGEPHLTKYNRKDISKKQYEEIWYKFLQGIE